VKEGAIKNEIIQISNFSEYLEFYINFGETDSDDIFWV